MLFRAERPLFNMSLCVRSFSRFFEDIKVFKKHFLKIAFTVFNKVLFRAFSLTGVDINTLSKLPPLPPNGIIVCGCQTIRLG